MRLDALILANSETDSVSGSSPMRFVLGGRTATIQAVSAYLDNYGQAAVPNPGDCHLSWESAPKLNGIALLSDLLQHGYQAALVNNFARDRDRFEGLLKQQPRTIVISTTFIVSKTALRKLVSEIKALAPGVPIIAGGPFVVQSCRIRERRMDPGFEHPEMRTSYLFQDYAEPEIDLYITASRGQDVLRKTLDLVRDNLPLNGRPNTAWYDPQGFSQFGPQVDTPIDFAEDRIDWASLPDDIFASKVVPLQASRGCPYRCAFCNFVHDKQTAYAKDINQIIGEMAAVAKRGVKYVWFVDDIYRLGKGDLTATSQAILEAKLDIKWMTMIRADSVKDVDFGLLKASGCHELQFGLESADPVVLAAMNKKANPDIYRATIRKALAAGINISAYFLFGHPGETRESINRTIAFMQEIQHPDLPGSLSWSIYPFILVPLSPIYEPEQRQRYGLDGYMLDWQHATMDAKTAREAIMQAVMALTDSAPIYRDDNLAMLDELSTTTRKEFFRARLQLAKLDTIGRAEPEVVYQTFNRILRRKPFDRAFQVSMSGAQIFPALSLDEVSI